MKFFKKSDLIVFAVLVVVSLVIWFGYRYFISGQPAKAEIYYYSELVETVDLNMHTERVFSIPQKPNVILHQSADGSIRFEQSDCPDKVCIHTGKINTIGESAACLPNGVLVKVVPSGERDRDDPDIVVGR